MPEAPRFLIGYGERLTEPVPPPLGGGAAPPPYDLHQARDRLAPQFVQASDVALRIPAEACPEDRVVSAMTLHPSFVAKSHFPARLLRAAGFESVGSRPRHVTPELNMRRTSDPDGKLRYRARPGTESRATTELFLESTRADLNSWARHLSDHSEELTDEEEGIIVVEQYRMPSAGERSRVPATLPDEVPLEVVLHAAGRAAYGSCLMPSKPSPACLASMSIWTAVSLSAGCASFRRRCRPVSLRAWPSSRSCASCARCLACDSSSRSTRFLERSRGSRSPCQRIPPSPLTSVSPSSMVEFDATLHWGGG